VPVAIVLLRGRHQVPWGQVLAAATLATLPVALVVFAFQPRIAQSFRAR
jgi:ABC-type glycerol-3-phosphate transport system permease component